MPVVDGGLVYVATSDYGDGYLAAVDAETGDEVWQFQGEDLSAPASSPLIADDTVFYMTVEQGTRDPDTFLYALDPDTGTQRWRYEANGLSGQPPAAGDGLVYMQGEEDDYLAIDIDTGEKRWEANGPHDAAPIYVDGRVILIGEDGVGTVLSASDGSQVWSKEVFAGGSSSLGHGSGPYAAVSDSVIYITTPDNELTALDLASGAEEWRAEPEADLAGSPTVSGDVVYVGAQGGFNSTDPTEIPSVLAFSTQGDELWQLTLNPYPEAYDIGLAVTESIAVSDGTLYLAGFANRYGVYVVSLSD